MNKVLLLCLGLLVPSAILSAEPSLLKRFPRRVHVTMTVEPRLIERELFQRGAFEQLLVLPIPRSDEKREIENLAIHMPEGMTADIKAFPETGDLYLPVFTKGPLREKVVVEYDAILYTVHYHLPERLTAYDRDSDIFRVNTGKGLRSQPDHPAIARISDQLWKGSAGALDFARKAYVYEQEHLKWKITGKYSTITETLANQGGDCGALTAVYISLLRRQGIPARANVGGILRSDDTFEWHVWPEFYLEGYGWVEVDPSFYTTAPGYFAYVDDMRIHFHRTGRGTVNYRGFSFETNGIQRLAMYRRTVADESTASDSDEEEIDYDVQIDVKTIERPFDDEGLNSADQVAQVTEAMFRRIESERKQMGLQTATDPEISAYLTEFLYSRNVQISHRSIPDCRTGCAEDEISQRGMDINAFLKLKGVNLSLYSWNVHTVGFHALDPIPFVFRNFDRSLLRDRRWSGMAVGYTFDQNKRQYTFAIMGLKR